jgi:acyl carrier protein
MERTDAALGDTFDRMQRTFRQVFDDETLELHRNMTAADVEGWDSLNHIDLIVALEREFRIKFTTAEISKLATVGDLLTLVDKKRVTS